MKSFDSSTISSRFQTAVELSRLLINHLITIRNIKIMVRFIPIFLSNKIIANIRKCYWIQSHVPKIIKSPSMESKELLGDNTEDSQESNEVENNIEKTEATNTETVDESVELSETNESFIESELTTNLNDDEAELTALEKTKPEVCHFYYFDTFFHIELNYYVFHLLL